MVSIFPFWPRLLMFPSYMFTGTMIRAMYTGLQKDVSVSKTRCLNIAVSAFWGLAVPCDIVLAKPANTPKKKCANASPSCASHQGFECFLDLMDRYHPAYLIHGHVHANYGRNFERIHHYKDTTIINCYEKWEIEFPSSAE